MALYRALGCANSSHKPSGFSTLVSLNTYPKKRISAFGAHYLLTKLKWGSLGTGTFLSEWNLSDGRSDELAPGPTKQGLSNSLEEF